MTVATLNQAFAIPGMLEFVPGPGGLTVAQVDNAAASARVSLHGAHVMHYQPRGKEPVLWMSRESYFSADKPIRGGIPLCWPWFGAHPGDPEKPAHGFARLLPWEIASTEKVDTATTRITLTLRSSETTRLIWPHDFELSLQLTIGPELGLELSSCNTGARPFTLTQALHTYFSVSDVRAISIRGFAGCPYIDTVGGSRTPGVQQGDVRIDAETDMVLQECSGEAEIYDPGHSRRIRIRTSGSRSAVVWNPWIAKAKRMPDFGDDEYQGMVCVESTNAGADQRTLQPGATHCLGTTLAVLPLN